MLTSQSIDTLEYFLRCDVFKFRNRPDQVRLIFGYVWTNFWHLTLNNRYFGEDPHQRTWGQLGLVRVHCSCLCWGFRQAMAVDRTAEFHAAVSSISARSSKSPAESRRLLSSNYNNDDHRPLKSTPKSEFSRMAAKIGHDINSTGAKLQRLAQCIFF